MARPVKKRRVCERPAVEGFAPIGRDCCDRITLSVEEYEALRLMDYLGCTQEECARQMGVARTTVQTVYERARGKLADMLVNGRALEIGGGNYEVCGLSEGCCGKHCRRNRLQEGCCGLEKRRRAEGGCQAKACRAEDRRHKSAERGGSV